MDVEALSHRTRRKRSAMAAAVAATTRAAQRVRGPRTEAEEPRPLFLNLSVLAEGLRFVSRDPESILTKISRDLLILIPRSWVVNLLTCVIV